VSDARHALYEERNEERNEERHEKVHVKICGVTSIEDAVMAVDLGAVGVNLIPTSLRVVDVSTARGIARAVGGRALVVGVVADLDVDAMRALRDAAELGCLQLHGGEAPDVLAPLLPHAYKALRIGSAADVAVADAYPGDHLLVDAKVPGALGGTGTTFDWALVVALAARRKLTLAGGLTPANVIAAVRATRPYCVDVASGVEREGKPRAKDAERVRAFIANARDA
jgi:phosphoribosylanthranilate isomerase